METPSDALRPPIAFNFVADVLHRRAAASPRATAVIGVSAAGEIAHWSYAQMAQASGRLAHALLESGIAKGDRVLVVMTRTPMWQVAMCACLHIGAVPVPCVSQSSASELRHRAEHSGARGVIASAAFVPRLQALGDRLTARFAHGASDDANATREAAAGWRDLGAILSADVAVPPTADMPAETPALMYFTSGSSGMPKGVMHAARGVYARGWQPWHQLGTCAGDVIWTTSDTGWTRAGSCLLFGPWLHGATALIVEGALTPAQRVDMLERQGVTIFGAVATELRQIVAEAPRRALPRLRCTLSAGEAMTAELAHAWRAFSGTPLVVGYGQTETPTSTLTDPHAEPVNGMIGKAIAGNVLAVLDAQGRPAAPGVQGEIAFAGSHPGLMLGYWRDGALADPVDRDGWHMTGDTGYVDADGEFYFVGRSDDVISSSGYRIGPTEVENAIARHPAVQECAVAASADAERGEVVKAYVVLRAGREASPALAAELQAFVKAEIAPYKYPRRIAFVDALPRTASGKISRRALREAERAELSAPRPGSAR